MKDPFQAAASCPSPLDVKKQVCTLAVITCSAPAKSEIIIENCLAIKLQTARLQQKTKMMPNDNQTLHICTGQQAS